MTGKIRNNCGKNYDKTNKGTKKETGKTITGNVPKVIKPKTNINDQILINQIFDLYGLKVRKTAAILKVTDHTTRMINPDIVSFEKEVDNIVKLGIFTCLPYGTDTTMFEDVISVLNKFIKIHAIDNMDLMYNLIVNQPVIDKEGMQKINKLFWNFVLDTDIDLPQNVRTCFLNLRNVYRTISKPQNYTNVNPVYPFIMSMLVSDLQHTTITKVYDLVKPLNKWYNLDLNRLWDYYTSNEAVPVDTIAKITNLVNKVFTNSNFNFLQMSSEDQLKLDAIKINLINSVITTNRYFYEVTYFRTIDVIRDKFEGTEKNKIVKHILNFVRMYTLTIKGITPKVIERLTAPVRYTYYMEIKNQFSIKPWNCNLPYVELLNLDTTKFNNLITRSKVDKVVDLENKVNTNVNEKEMGA